MMMSDRHTAELDADGFMGIVGRHPAMQRVFDLIRRIGPSSAPVLVTGESGTGKELVARAIHEISPRRGDALVPVHCGAIPEELLESELFGHVKGAFTGAVNARTGRFRLAHGGTIFLDEIGEMSPRFQVKLLRVLEDGTFDQVGGTTTQRVDVRVVAATHRDLASLAEKGDFRVDLLYRLDVVSIHLPALRERRDDIPLLARHFLSHIAGRGFPSLRLSDDAADLLTSYDWPGNVRELRNVLERAALLGDGAGVLRACDLPASIQSSRPVAAVATEATEVRPQSAGVDRAAGTEADSAAAEPWHFGPEGADFYAELDLFERRMIGRALQLSRGSKREAARLLNLNRTTLLEKLKRKSWNSVDLAAEGSTLEGVTPYGPSVVLPGGVEATILVDSHWTVGEPGPSTVALPAISGGPTRDRQWIPVGAAQPAVA